MFVTAIAVALSLQSMADAQKRFVELRVSAGERSALGDQQRWMEVLSKVGADRVSSKSNRYATQPAIKEIQSSGAVTVQVSGVLSGDKIILPGKTYSIRNVAGIRDFIQKLRDDGATVALADKKAFGLTSEQLVDVHTELMATIEMETKGTNAAQTIERVLAQQKYKVVIDRQSSSVLSRSTISEELNGFTIGTGVAAMVRPLGLVLVPQRQQGGNIELRLVDSVRADENWPVGWPIEKPVSKVEPKLFERFELEIRNIPLHSVLAAIEQRVGIPFLYDQNAIARAGIELKKTRVNLASRRIAYMVALRKLLSQSKPQLIQELRVDENGKPFLWISTAR